MLFFNADMSGKGEREVLNLLPKITTMQTARYILFDFDGKFWPIPDLAFTLYNRIAGEYGCEPLKPEDKQIIAKKGRRIAQRIQHAYEARPGSHYAFGKTSTTRCLT